MLSQIDFDALYTQMRQGATKKITFSTSLTLGEIIKDILPYLSNEVQAASENEAFLRKTRLQ